MVAPRVLGSLLNAVATAMRDRGKVDLTRLPRMADFAEWVTAGESAFGWTPGTILRDYEGNRASADQAILEAAPITPGICLLAKNGWQGTPTDLFKKLSEISPNRYSKTWPADPKSLSDLMRRLAPNFRGIGIEFKFGKTAGLNSARFISIGKMPKTCDASVASNPKNSNCGASDACDAGLPMISGKETSND